MIEPGMILLSVLLLNVGIVSMIFSFQYDYALCFTGALLMAVAGLCWLLFELSPCSASGGWECDYYSGELL